MTKSYKSQKIASEIKFSAENALKNNKFKFVFTSILIVVSIVVGVIVAIKTNAGGTFKMLQDINYKGFKDGVVASSSAFFSRSFSLLFNVLLLFLLSLSTWLFPVAEVLFCYRGYLFGLNFALIFIFYGFGSMISAIIIVLPCQLLIFVVLQFLYFSLLRASKNYKSYGSCGVSRANIILIGALALLLLNLVETILLFLLNGKVIMIL